MHDRRSQPACSRAFTVVELLLVIVLLAILGTLFAPVSSRVRARAEGARCASNLRALHASLGAYVSDRSHWPQQPPELEKRAAQEWWVNELRSYGTTQQAWACPSLARHLDETGTPDELRPFTHYAVTPFDKRQFTPYRWSGQPWAIELGNLHGNGNLMIFPDGSVRAFNDIYRERTGRPVPTGLRP